MTHCSCFLCSGQYRSTWVDEMTDYLQSGSAYCDDDDEEEEEDDLDGFVASDEEFSDQEADYSSEIRKIFGYDKSRSVVPEFLYLC